MIFKAGRFIDDQHEWFRPQRNQSPLQRGANETFKVHDDNICGGVEGLICEAIGIEFRFLHPYWLNHGAGTDHEQLQGFRQAVVDVEAGAGFAQARLEEEGERAIPLQRMVNSRGLVGVEHSMILMKIKGCVNNKLFLTTS